MPVVGRTVVERVVLPYVAVYAQVAVVVPADDGPVRPRDEQEHDEVDDQAGQGDGEDHHRDPVPQVEPEIDVAVHASDRASSTARCGIIVIAAGTFGQWRDRTRVSPCHAARP